MSIPITVGVSASTAIAGEAGGPFTNNAEIVFSQGGAVSLGPTDQTNTPNLSPVAVSSAFPGSSTSPNPSAWNNGPGVVASASGFGGMSKLTVIALLAGAGVGIWLLMKG